MAKSAPKKAKPVAKAKARVKETAKLKGKAAVVPKAKAKNSGPGRPAGASNYVPDKPLTVRDTATFRMAADADVKGGVKHARIYAKDVESSLHLQALCKAIDKANPDLMKLLKKLAKSA